MITLNNAREMAMLIAEYSQACEQVGYWRGLRDYEHSLKAAIKKRDEIENTLLLRMIRG